MKLLRETIRRLILEARRKRNSWKSLPRQVSPEEQYMDGYEDASAGRDARRQDPEYLRGYDDFLEEDHGEYIELSREYHDYAGK